MPFSCNLHEYFFSFFPSDKARCLVLARTHLRLVPTIPSTAISQALGGGGVGEGGLLGKSNLILYKRVIIPLFQAKTT